MLDEIGEYRLLLVKSVYLSAILVILLGSYSQFYRARLMSTQMCRDA